MDLNPARFWSYRRNQRPTAEEVRAHYGDNPPRTDRYPFEQFEGCGAYNEYGIFIFGTVPPWIRGWVPDHYPPRQIPDLRPFNPNRCEELTEARIPIHVMEHLVMRDLHRKDTEILQHMLQFWQYRTELHFRLTQKFIGLSQKLLKLERFNQFRNESLDTPYVLARQVFNSWKAMTKTGELLPIIQAVDKSITKDITNKTTRL